MTNDATGDAAVIERLVGVYHADGSRRGELAYLVRKLTGRGHCALCDITHGALRRKKTFDDCMAGLPAPFELVHLDERGDDVAAASDGRTPCVLARTGGGLVVLVDAAGLAACGSDPARLRGAIDQSVDRLGLRWPVPA